MKEFKYLTSYEMTTGYYYDGEWCTTTKICTIEANSKSKLLKLIEHTTKEKTSSGSTIDFDEVSGTVKLKWSPNIWTTDL